jgi:hypothetical protein
MPRAPALTPTQAATTLVGALERVIYANDNNACGGVVKLAGAELTNVDQQKGAAEVRMAGVVMIDGRPFDLAPQVLLDAGHQATHVGGQVKLAGVFRRHDESKLVRFAQARFFEGPTPHRSLGPVEHAFGTVRFDAVALDVPEVNQASPLARGAGCIMRGRFGWTR